MKTTILILSVLLLLPFAGCEKEPLATKPMVKWEWIRTTGGILGINQTPKTLGYTYCIAFTQEGYYQVYDKNNHLVSSTPFSIVKRISIFDRKEHDMIALHDRIWASLEIRKDTLFLSEEGDDGFFMVFVKKWLVNLKKGECSSPIQY